MNPKTEENLKWNSEFVEKCLFWGMRYFQWFCKPEPKDFENCET